ncbi:CASC3/Barentsz eIF4AIII binding-domain-containing protein [Lasiosphaeria hispida]|uniref:CASC3/Barentsz eIF4AIII binding-domain-containing protein n=1 Tax=Lasiosphaeria hispida TaxID=260671 RepID=A0AAJ0HPZ7_9PEZI|nr:CASC3/Barentsz eIF4AIII binding-domain-containing protein [Lasiosphaeria hispida]
MAAAAPRRRKIIGHRRRVEDEGEDEAGPEALELDDDSLTDGSIASDEHDQADDSDTSNVDEMSPTTPNAHKSIGNGAAKKPGFRRQPDAVSGERPVAKPVQPIVADNETMLAGLSLADKDDAAQALNFDDVQPDSAPRDAAPIIVSSSPVPRQPGRVPVQELKRREHDEYRRKRDEDPTFVPNRGAFFLHDHRHAGPAANGFRPFPRPARGRGRGAFAGPFAPVSQLHNPVPDPTTNGPWAHDMHEAVVQPTTHHHRQTRYLPDNEGPPNGNGIVPTAPQSKMPINRAMSTERPLGNVTIRVFIPEVVNTPKMFPGISLKQYTKLPDHRPPLRRDKPVRISLPYLERMPRYIYPANDRSFIFIPRAMRPNQQRVRGKGPRSAMGGSVGPFSRRTSVFGSYYGSVYSPSVLSRRSSIAPDLGREFIISPTGSVISRPPMAVDNSRPVVRLPPHNQQQGGSMPTSAPPDPAAGAESSINDLPQPQTHPLPQKPTFQENRTNAIPMHQPRPQKTVSLESIESPAQQMAAAPPYQQAAFHHQVPPQVSNTYPQDTHVRQPSYHSQPIHTPGPLSQIPERAIHAAPFQPNAYPQPGFYNQPYAMMQQAPYYYPQQYNNMGPNASAPVFVPAAQQNQPLGYNPSGQPDAQSNHGGGQGGSAQGLVAQEINGTYYYYDANQLSAMTGVPPFPTGQQYAPGMVGMGGMMTPSPDGFYYPQPAPGMVYYP